MRNLLIRAIVTLFVANALFAQQPLFAAGNRGGPTPAPTTITLSPGLTSTPGTYNTGVQTAKNGDTLSTQFTPTPKSVNYTVLSTDTARLLYMTAASKTFTVPNPGVAGTPSFAFGNDGTNGYTLATVGGTATFYGSTHCTGATTASIPVNVSVQIFDDGTNYQCAEQTSASGGGSSVAATPQGRLTLVTTVPVMVSDQTAKTTIYYDSYLGNLYPNWNGSAMANVTITSDEISMGLDAGVPHIASGSVYDIFGTAGAAVCAGPAWTSTTARGTGAGTTELQLKSGVWTNKNSLTHCWGGASGTTDLGAIAANQGTYLGTFYATANGQTGMAFTPIAAAGGTNNVLGLWNAYNRVEYAAVNTDSNSNYAGNGASTYGAADGSNNYRITYIDGLALSSPSAWAQIPVSPGGAQGIVGLARDSTTTQDTGFPISGSSEIGAAASYSYVPAGGLHYIQAIEYSTTTAPHFANAKLGKLGMRIGM